MPKAPDPIHGDFLCPALDQPGWRLVRGATLTFDAKGRIRSLVEGGPPQAETVRDAVWLPGFVDAHVHYPQTRVVGSASGPLLDWLDRTTFPEEARFSDATYAWAVAREFCGALLRHGTTSAAIFSSPHPRATDLLFEALKQSGLRAMAGLTLMDRGAPDANLLPVGPALEACEQLIERWHGFDDDRLRFCLTPRFALSCTPKLLRGAADLAERFALPVQTHLSENPAEIAATMELFGESADYLGVYADHGLLHDRALFAHAIHLSDSEWGRLSQRGAALAHCPDSNFFLGSGCMRLKEAHRRGVRVGIGTDVGGGRSFSVQRCAARGYDASLIVGEPVTASDLLWHATRGGALALGQGDRVGALEPGYEADLVALERPDPDHRVDLLEALLFRLDHGPALRTVVRGRTLWDLDAA